ncbi:unnamed protein product [Schistosoma haematobium]|nr:unnamed protein product [Schistosoma haematobium]
MDIKRSTEFQYPPMLQNPFNENEISSVVHIEHGSCCAFFKTVRTVLIRSQVTILEGVKAMKFVPIAFVSPILQLINMIHIEKLEDK